MHVDSNSSADDLSGALASLLALALEPEQANPEVTVETSAFVKQVKPHVYKSRLCVFHAAGRCSHGDRCSFAHSPFELADGKVLMCPQLETFGFCDEPDCPLAHSVTELKVLPKVQKTAWCRYYPMGKCRAGSACRHAHSLHEMDPAALQVVHNQQQIHLYPERLDNECFDDSFLHEQDYDLIGLQRTLLGLASEVERLRLQRE